MVIQFKFKKINKRTCMTILATLHIMPFDFITNIAHVLQQPFTFISIQSHIFKLFYNKYEYD